MVRIIRVIQLYLFLLMALAVEGAVYYLYQYTLPPEVPLLYTKRWGEPQLVRKEWLLVVPLVTVLIVIINDILMKTVLKKDILLRSILYWITLFCVFTATFAWVKIILKVG